MVHGKGLFKSHSTRRLVKGLSQVPVKKMRNKISEHLKIRCRAG